jgi:hypothetical protein
MRKKKMLKGCKTKRESGSRVGEGKENLRAHFASPVRTRTDLTRWMQVLWKHFLKL